MIINCLPPCVLFTSVLFRVAYFHILIISFPKKRSDMIQRATFTINGSLTGVTRVCLQKQYSSTRKYKITLNYRLCFRFAVSRIDSSDSISYGYNMILMSAFGAFGYLPKLAKNFMKFRDVCSHFIIKFLIKTKQTKHSIIDKLFLCYSLTFSLIWLIFIRRTFLANCFGGSTLTQHE